MGLDVYWLDESKTVIQGDYINPCTWADIAEGSDRARAMIREVEHPICSIHNAVGFQLPSGNPFPHLLREFQLTPSNLVLTILITDRHLVRSVIRAFLRVYKQNMEVVSTVAEAEVRIATWRSRQATFESYPSDARNKPESGS